MLRRLVMALGVVLSVCAYPFAHAASAQAGSVALQDAVSASGMSAQERTAFAQLRAKAGPSGRGPIDLTDATQRLAYYAMLRMHGITRESRPELFADFDRTIAEQTRRKASGLPVDVDDCKLPTGANSPSGLGNLREIIDIDASSDFKTVSARALDTVVERPTYVLDLLDVYDEHWENHLSSGKDEWFTTPVGLCTDDKCLSPQLQLFQTEKKAGNNPTGGPINVFGTFQFRAGSFHSSPCFVLLPTPVHFLPKSMTLDHPSVQSGDDPNRPIIVCLNRKNKSAQYPDGCDYGPMESFVDNYSAKVLLYVVGNVVYNDPLAPIDGIDQQGVPNVDGELTVIAPTGGACPVLKLDGDRLRSHMSAGPDTSPRKDTLSFHWPPPAPGHPDNDYGDPADFGKLCWDKATHHQGVQTNQLWDFFMTVHAKTLNTSGVPTYTVVASFLSQAYGDTVNTIKVPKIEFEFGCIGGGAQITMADGTFKPIEKVQIGDRVASPNGPLQVKGVTDGVDDKFVKISTPAGEPLYVTETHPVALGDGNETPGAGGQLVQAEDLLKTAVGTAGANRKVVWKPRDGAPLLQIFTAERPSIGMHPVYNLTLEHVDGTPIVRPEDARFYANGIVVGDNRAQGSLEQKKLQAAATLPKYPLGALERVDFENWLAQGQGHRPAPSTHDNQRGGL